jgi:hypothetical protein
MLGKNSTGSDKSNIDEYNEKVNNKANRGGTEGRKHSSAKKRKGTATPTKSQKKAASNTMHDTGKRSFLEDSLIV